MPVKLRARNGIVKALKDVALFHRVPFAHKTGYSEWLPLIVDEHQKDYFGLTKEGYWSVKGNEGVVILDQENRKVFSVLMLTFDIDEVVKELTLFESMIDADVNIVSEFPFTDIVLAGFESASDYWAELAFNWYDQLSKRGKQNCKNSLHFVMTDKRFSQIIRHRAKKEYYKKS